MNLTQPTPAPPQPSRLAIVRKKRDIASDVRELLEMQRDLARIVQLHMLVTQHIVNRLDLTTQTNVSDSDGFGVNKPY